MSVKYGEGGREEGRQGEREREREREMSIKKITCHIRYLKEHGRREVDTLHQLEVDVHVEGNLTSTLNDLLFGTSLVTTLSL